MFMKCIIITGIGTHTVCQYVLMDHIMSAHNKPVSSQLHRHWLQLTGLSGLSKQYGCLGEQDNKFSIKHGRLTIFVCGNVAGV